MLSYAKIMIDQEWPMIKLGNFDPSAAAIAMDAIDATGSLVPASPFVFGRPLADDQPVE
jgi:hypothetical protein